MQRGFYVKMNVIYIFLLWVICSFVGIMLLGILIPNDVVFAFCIALVLGFVATLDKT